ncbi:MAG: HlyD family efflux transporter periplasmic adaptor subunit [Planctomycetales bacterium]|nr:HlyD family efflux transporter periplasmic adaptor subunit [Planctomycetales bacterium]
MVGSSSPIPTPMNYRVQRITYRWLPIAVFVIGFLAMFWMWDRQAQMGNGVGAVVATVKTVHSGASGKVIPFPDRPYWTSLDRVEKGDVICVLDDDMIQARLNTLQVTRDQLALEVNAKQAEIAWQLQLDRADWESDYTSEITRAAFQLADYELEIRRLEGNRLTNVVALEGRKARYGHLESGGIAITESLKDVARYAAQEMQERIVQAEETLRKIEHEKEKISELYTMAEERKSKFPTQDTEMISRMLAPLMKQMEVVDAQMQELAVEAEGLVVRAPVSGVVHEVMVGPDDAVQAGAPILSIASEDDSTIVSYVRNDQRVYPKVNMKVKVRNRNSVHRPVDSTITAIGTQVVAILQQKIRDPAIPEWGTPVYIKRPPSLYARPGELLDIVFPVTREANDARRSQSLNTANEPQPMDTADATL